MNGYIKNLGVILRKAQGVVDVDTAQPIDIGDEVLSIRQECDELRDEVARLIHDIERHIAIASAEADARVVAEARLRELREAVAKEFTIARGFVSALQYQTTTEQDVPMVLRQIDKIHASLAKSGEP
jgi:hypothetical protein